MMSRLPDEIFKQISYDISGIIALFQNLALQFYRCNISEILIVRGLKLYQLIEDDG